MTILRHGIRAVRSLRFLFLPPIPYPLGNASDSCYLFFTNFELSSLTLIHSSTLFQSYGTKVIGMGEEWENKLIEINTNPLLRKTIEDLSYTDKNTVFDAFAEGLDSLFSYNYIFKEFGFLSPLYWKLYKNWKGTIVIKKTNIVNLPFVENTQYVRKRKFR